jgi:Flp pilus assembly protein CpaB
VDSEAAIGSIVRPGDRVDVLVHVRADPNRGLRETVTLGVLQNVKVFAVNDSWEAQSSDKAVAAKTVSLEVTPTEAQLVTLAGETGQIRLLMRGPDDDKRVEYTTKYFRDIVGVEGNAAKPTTKSVAEEAIWKAIKALQAKPEGTPQTKQAVAQEKPEKTTVAFVAPKNQQHMMVVMNGDDATAMLLEAPQGQSNQGVWRVRATSKGESPEGVKPVPAKSRSAAQRGAVSAPSAPAEPAPTEGSAAAHKPKEGGAGPDPVKNLEALEQQIKAAEKGP